MNYSSAMLEILLRQHDENRAALLKQLEEARERENPIKPVECYVLRDREGNVHGCRIDLRHGHPIMGDTRPPVYNVSRDTAIAGKWWVKVGEVL